MPRRPCPRPCRGRSWGHEPSTAKREEEGRSRPAARAKVLPRRRARGAGATRAATAATAAAITLAGVAASAGYPTPGARAETLQEAAGTAGAAPARCPEHPLTGSSVPSEFVEVDGTVLSTADDGVHGGGCGSRTARGPAPSWSRTSSAARSTTLTTASPPPRRLPTVGPAKYRTGRDAVLHRQRRRPRQGAVESEITKAGTVLVKDINRSLCGCSGPVLCHRCGRKLYFTANDGIHGGRCGGRTAPRPAPSSSRTSPAVIPARTLEVRTPDHGERKGLLHRHRRQSTAGSVEY